MTLPQPPKGSPRYFWKNAPALSGSLIRDPQLCHCGHYLARRGGDLRREMP